MATDPDKAPRAGEPQLSVLRADPGAAAASREGGRTEAQLRARVQQLEASLADAGQCLQDAERRAAELLAAQTQIESLQQQLDVITSGRTWRLTAPLRRAMAWIRRLLGRSSAR